MSVVEKDASNDTNKSTNDHSTDQDSSNIILPLIEPVITSDELKTNNSDDEVTHQNEQNLSTVSANQSGQENPIKSSPTAVIRCTAILLSIFASANFTCGTFGLKQLPVELFDGLLSRFVLQSFIVLMVILYKKHKFFYGSRRLIILQIIRAVLITASAFLFFLSYHYIPLPDVTICRYTRIAWIAILAMIILRESISASTVIAIVLTLTGVTLVVQPAFLTDIYQSLLSNRTASITVNETTTIGHVAPVNHKRVLGLTVAIISSLSESLGLVINKKLLTAKVPPTVIIFQYSALSVVVLLVQHLYNRFIHDKYATQPLLTWSFLAAICLSVLLVNYVALSQQALKLEHPAIVSIAGSSDILFSIILQSLFTIEKSNGFVLLGALLVMSGIFLVGIDQFWKDRRNSLKKKSKLETTTNPDENQSFPRA